MKCFYQVSLRVMPVAIAWCLLDGDGLNLAAQEFTSKRTILSGMGEHLLTEKQDLRLAFFSSVEDLDRSVHRGFCLLIPDGVFEHARKFSTNDCATVKAALDKYATNHIGLHYQVRVVRKDAILQTPLGLGADPATKAAVQDIKLQGGDVIIVTRKE